jgi:DNA-binding transcriptional LysR family regulator
MATIDLNLLRVFNVLYEERSVTRAARRLGLTQSAVSHALGRLRIVLDDRLFVREPSGLQPTARAAQIAPRVRQGLADLQGALSLPLFDPVTSERLFNLSAGSYFCTLLVPDLIARARAAAPRLRFQIWNPAADLLERLDQGRLDLAFTGPAKNLSRIRSEALFDDEMAWIARADSPLARGIASRAALDAAPRVAIQPTSELSVSAMIATAARSRGSNTTLFGGSDSADIVVHDAAAAIAVVRGSDAVALVPRGLVEGRVDPAVAIVTLEEPNLPLTLFMRWHAKAEDDPGLAWLRDIARGVSAAARHA